MAEASGKSLRRWLRPTLEVLVAFAAAALFLAFCVHIRVDPLQRTGQVSALAALQVRFIAFVVPVIAALVVAARVRDGRHFELTSRLACAAIAGFVGAFVAGGILVALRGTPWCLNARGGDMDIMVMWANAIQHGPAGLEPPPFYPPLFPHVLSWYMQVIDEPGFYAMKHLQIIGTALFGPVAYCAWRMLLRPGWALGIGLAAMFVVLDPYKPAGPLVLVVLVPLLIKFFTVLRRAHERTPHELLKLGVAFGAGTGLLFLTYSGWFRWSLPGVVLAGLVVFPWKGVKKPALLFGAVTLIVFGIAIASYVKGILTFREAVAAATQGQGPMFRDDYLHFDTAIDPAYVAMWKGDLPGATNPQDWPPPGELGGVGVYTALALLGFGAAIALARRRTAVIVLSLVFLGVWFQRFWVASDLWATGLVQLYPRTTIELAHLLVILAGFGLYYAVEFAARRYDPGGKHGPSRLIGAVCALAVLFGMAASSVANRYMPYDSLPRTPGFFAFAAHDAKKQSLSPDPAKALSK